MSSFTPENDFGGKTKISLFYDLLLNSISAIAAIKQFYRKT
jgi:hypothetical protein